MVPRIGSQGRSFKGAAGYYLHDRNADTAERVAFTHTENLATDDPEMAWRLMAYTAMNAENLKRQAGVPRTGAKSEKPVFTLSLSWHTEEELEQEHMITAMNEALAALGLQNRQALMVGHDDREHQHIHAMVNLVSPENGRSTGLSYSREKLSRWAQGYEEQRGKIYCQERVQNNRRRDRERGRRGVDRQNSQPKAKACFPRHKDPESDLKAEITRIYRTARNAAEFKAGVQKLGFRLAQGDRVLLIDAKGKMYSLSRQIEAAKAKDIRAKLVGLELPDVDAVRRSIIERADRENKKNAERWKQERLSHAVASNAASRSRFAQKLAAIDARNEKDYGEAERDLRGEINAMENAMAKTGRTRRAWLKLSGQMTRRKEDLENKKSNLASILARKEERRAFVVKVLEQRKTTAASLAERLKAFQQPAPEQDQQQQRQTDRAGERTTTKARNVPTPERPKTQAIVSEPAAIDTISSKPTPANDFEEAASKHGTTPEYEQARAAKMRQRQREQSRDRDRGPERER